MSIPGEVTRCVAPDGSCQLCGDVAVVGLITAMDAATRTATVELPGGPATVALDFVEASIGDQVLVHLGFAIEKVVMA